MNNPADKPTAAAEALARKSEPWVWALDPPDCSSAGARLASIARARVILGELRWSAETEAYEETVST